MPQAGLWPLALQFHVPRLFPIIFTVPLFLGGHLYSTLRH